MSYMKQKEQVICACGCEDFTKVPIDLLSYPPVHIYRCVQCGEEQHIRSDETLEQDIVKIYR